MNKLTQALNAQYLPGDVIELTNGHRASIKGHPSIDGEVYTYTAVDLTTFETFTFTANA